MKEQVSTEKPIALFQPDEGQGFLRGGMRSRRVSSTSRARPSNRHTRWSAK